MSETVFPKLTTPKNALNPPLLKRFLSDRPVPYSTAIEGAELYVSKMPPEGVEWLYMKPFDIRPGHFEYFKLMYQILNLLQVMRIRQGGRILEIGSGPGWVTEILLMLGYKVDALEPSADLIKIAQDRAKALAEHYHFKALDNLQFHQSTIEEINFDDESFDAIIYFDVLHHVVDEEKALEKTFRYLNSGGCIGVVESAWHPDYKALEKELLIEMKRFGTLENPFSLEYLDYLLNKHGFVEIERYISVNGFFSSEQVSQPIEQFALFPIKASNNITARKPYGAFRECSDLDATTNAEIILLSGGIDPQQGIANLFLRLKNTGETLWRSSANKQGYITIALRQGIPGQQGFLEAAERHPLPDVVRPDHSIDLSLHFTLPDHISFEGWELDLVCEGLFWFSMRGIKSCPVNSIE